MSVAAAVIRLRAKADQTIEQVAAGTRLTPAVVRGIEMGRVGLQDWQLAALAKHFCVTVEELTA